MNAAFDSHTHLQFSEFNEDRDKVIERAAEAGVSHMIIVGIDPESCRRALELAEQHDSLFAAIGSHPYEADHLTDEILAGIRDMLQHPKAIALGEIGLDYFREYSTRENQRAALHRLLELAEETALPVIIHNRNADNDLADILSSHAESLRGGILHCFAGNPELIEAADRWDFHISFTGNITFPKANELRDAARKISLDKLLIETDSPYLAPQKWRGKRCEPAYVVEVARTIADVKGLSFEEVAETTTSNARNLFGLG